MPRNTCCVSGCPFVVNEGIPLHYFPNPEKEEVRFLNWVKAVGGGIASLDSNTIYKTHRICGRHFQDVYLYPKNRLCRLAIPSLHLPSGDESVPVISPLIPVCQPSIHEATLLHSDVTLDSQSVNAVENKPCSSASSKGLFLVSSQPSTSHSDTKRCPTSGKSAKTRLCRSGTFLDWKQRNQLKMMQLRLRRCLKDKQTFRKRYLLAEKISKSRAFEILTKNMSRSAIMLFKMQMQDRKNPRGRRFTLDEKILGLSLYKPSPKHYRLLSQLCVLPSRRTLQNVLRKVDLTPGITEKNFQNLKTKVERMPNKHKFCSILFDEMSIASGINYDKAHDKITGFVDNGTRRELIFSDHVLVFMVRGILKKYKQPLAYSFCSGTTKTVDLKTQLKRIIEKVQAIGLKVVATICDQGATNLAAINQLVEETREEYLKRNEEFRGGFFEVTGVKIVPIYDPPHLIKGVRNNLLNKNLKYTKDGKVRVAKWSHIENMYHRSPTFRGLKLVHKLTALHVVPSMIPKMRVKYCTQVFSRSVGVALGYMAESGSLPEESVDTAELLLLFDDIFDSVNANFHRVEGKIYKSAVTPRSPHLKFWNSILPILKSMRYINNDNKETIVPSLTSWVKTIEGFKLIINYLQSQGLNSILLRNMNQDPLENFFGAIRAHGCANVMPNSAAFENAFKTLLLNNITSAHSLQGNCEKDDSVCLQSLKSFIVTPSNENTVDNEIAHINDYHFNMDLINTQTMLESRSRVHIEKCAAIAYCSGWMATKAKKFVFKKCDSCKKSLITENIEDFHKFIIKKEYCGKRWLCYPTRALFDFFAQAEHITLEVLKNDAHIDKIVQYICVIVTLHIDFNFISCEMHKNALTNYLLNKSVVFFIMNWCKEVSSNVLNGKSYYNFATADNNQMDPIIEQARNKYIKGKGRKRLTQTGVTINV